MRRFLVFFFCSLAVVAWAKPGPGFMPNRNKRKPRISGGVQRGPQYSQPNAPPSAAAIPNLIAASNPNSPNSIAAQGLGFGGTDCGQSIKSQLAALTAQANALKAQVDSITAQIKAAAASQAACGCCSIAQANCALGYANKATALAIQLLPIAAQLTAMTSQLQSLQAQASSCTGGGGTAQAQPPAITLANVAKRFNVPLAGTTASFGGGSALEQLQGLDEQGELADFDGRAPAVSKALSAYQSAAARAGQWGARVEAGRALAKQEPDFSNPSAAAQEEYLKINYKELGPKYEALAHDRAEAADRVAGETLAAISAPAPFMDVAGALIKADPVEGGELPGQAWADKASDGLWEGMKDQLFKNANMSVQGQAMDKTLEIFGKVGESKNLIGSLYDAIDEMGSVGMSNIKTEVLLAKLDKYFDNLRESVAQPNPTKSFADSGVGE